MRLLDLITLYDEALEWQDDDPLLDDHVPPATAPVTWASSEAS